MAVVLDQHHGFEPPVRSSPRCRIPSLTNFDFFKHETNQTGVDLPRRQEVIRGGSISRSSSTPCFTLTTRVKDEFNKSGRVELVSGHNLARVRALTAEVAVAIATGVNSIPSSSGLGGAYILSSQNGDMIAVAKPIDEEPLALNNPKGFTGKVLGQPGLKRSIRVGETGIRELAAYLLDHEGFAGVPPTALVKFSNLTFHTNKSTPVATPPYKIASLQQYVDHESDAGDLGPSCFSVSSVHRIGILDVRLLNIDRHCGNILVRKYKNEKYCLDGAELIPIDHGLSLPEWLDDPYFEWLHWPQASTPFSEEEMEYINNLDPYEDANLLRTQIPCLSESAIRVLMVCTIFLKRAASIGLCLRDIGEIMTRDYHGGGETMSILENLCVTTKNTVPLLNNYGDGYQVESVEDVQVFEFDEDYEHSFKAICESFKGSMGKPLCTPKSQSNTRPNLTKSVTFAAPSRKFELEDISLGEMDEQEWEFFLDIFDNILPKVFDDRKSIGVLHRMGSA